MKQPWIRSPFYDGVWILAPGLLPVLAVIIFPAFFMAQATELSTASWVILILLVDVAHVYSTIYKTYFNRASLAKFNVLFKITPLICWIVGTLLYSIDSLVFWRCLAYLAVFHFIRQQYGFMRIYSRGQQIPRWAGAVHTICIYAFTVLPVLIWHAQGQKNFNWFVENDFLYFDSPLLGSFFTVLFFICVMSYVTTEIFLYRKYKLINVPRLLLMSGTALSWYVGIVVYDGDLTFTFLNVIAHGVPYMALIWAGERRQANVNQPGILRYFFRSYGVVLFAGLLFLFAFIEEGLWDSLIWREHASVFSSFYVLDPVSHHKLLCFLVPLLSLPQSVHYVLDGFIWKRERPAAQTAEALSPH